MDRFVKRYEGILKSRAKTSEDVIAKRAAFLSDRISWRISRQIESGTIWGWSQRI